MGNLRLKMNRHPGVIAGPSGPGLALAAGLSLAAHMGLLASLLHGLPDGSSPPQPLQTYVVDIVIENGPLGAGGLGAAQALKRMALKAQQRSLPSRKEVDHEDQKDVPVIKVATSESPAISKPLPKGEKAADKTQVAPRPLVAAAEQDASTGPTPPLRQMSEAIAIPQAATTLQQKALSEIRPQRPSPEHPVDKQMEPSQPNAGREIATPDAETAVLLPHQGPDALRQPSPVKGVSYMTGRSGNMPPEYPKRARRRGYEGRVVIRVIVTPMGNVNSTEMVESSGHDILDRAAILAVRHWRFVPATQDGEPIIGIIDVPISFWLNQHTTQGNDTL